MSQRVHAVIERLNQLVEPETLRTYGELNLISDVTMTDDESVKIVFMPTSPVCPMTLKIGLDIKEAASSVEGIKKVVVECRGHVKDAAVNKVLNRTVSQKA